jgi:aryl-alcohol dehydrogenase-like predicted oxidoreductase
MSERIGRREFVREGAALVAGAVAASALAADAPKPDPKEILNYNPKMHYRRLGKTNLMLSEISLGGHWKDRGGGGVWDTFTSDQVPPDVVKNRSEVVSACIDAGVNYLDITTAAECLSYGAALKGRRDKMLIGADDHRLGPRNPANSNVKALVHNVDECLRRLGTDYLDIWRVQALQRGGHPDSEVAVWIEAYQKIHEAGKARHFGISTHTRPWIQHVIEKFPEVEMVIFPCTARTREKGQKPNSENVVEGDMVQGWHSDKTKSVFQTVREKNVGLVTIKPFVGGFLFKSQAKFPVLGAGSKAENDLARLVLQSILTNDAITAVVPGVTTVYEVDNAVRASSPRQVVLTAPEKERVARAAEDCWQHLPEHYAWLRDWEVV